MDLTLDPQAQAAIDLAKRSVTENDEIDAGLLLAAIYHTTDLRDRFPQLGDVLDEPQPQRDTPLERVNVVQPLRSILGSLASRGVRIGAEELFRAILESRSGRDYLKGRGVAEQQLTELRGTRPAEAAATSPWRASEQRAEAIDALASFGRMLTDQEPPYRGVVRMERTLGSLVRTLARMRRRNAIVVGHPGTGKSAVVYELARLLFRGATSVDHTRIPERLRDMDIFELSPSFLRSGASFVGQYDERVKTLISALETHPKIILFVDEVHSLFRSSLHDKGPFSEANESFKGVLARGQITCLGCTTPAEYRHYIEPDAALARRFNVIRLEPPSREDVRDILKARRSKMEEYYDPLRISDSILEKAIELSDEYLPSRYQPDKSITLLDDACASCAVSATATTEDEVPERALWTALEDMIGHSVVRTETVSEAELLARLSEGIIGQDDALKRIARSFVAGLGRWEKRAAPRGVYFFCGPTGVGKTETAVQLGRFLGGGQDAMIRINCNTLQGSGHDSGPAINVLLGPPPGYVGYVRGQGGVLSKVRDLPESIVLFDEIEKADPGVGKVLLQILDDGRVEDSDSHLLDFRRAFIVFTTNAGCLYDTDSRVGFPVSKSGTRAAPRADVEMVKDEMRRLGFGEEFLGRIDEFLVFRGLDREATRRIIERRLAKLQDTAELRGYGFEWEEEVMDYLASHWQPRFGVRHLITVLRNRIVEQLSVADTQGELRGVKKIRLQVLGTADADESVNPGGLARRERRDETLVVHLI